MMSGTGSGMNTRYYEILNVSKTVLQEDLKMAYFIASNTWLCDPEKTKEVAEAYEVLSDPEKREIYDQNGEDALRMCGGGGRPDPADLYRLTFGAFSEVGVGGLLCRRIKNVVHPLKVSLEELYNGTSKEFSISINVMCSKCKGTGSKSGASMKCSGCQGSGATAPSPFLRARPSHNSNKFQICQQCYGTGETISDHCTQCNGDKVVQEKQDYCVVVEKGMTNGHEIVFPKEGRDKFIGDFVIFVLQEEEHPVFQRQGDDLIFKHTLSLTEALRGFEFVLTHLDNRELKIRSTPGEIIKPGQVKVINEEGMPVYQRPQVKVINEGMPVYQRPDMKGKLYIHFSVDFSLPPELYKDLESVLPPRTSALTDIELANCEKPTLHNVSIEGMRKPARQPNEEGEDMHGLAKRAQH